MAHKRDQHGNVSLTLPQDGALKVGNFKARAKETESPGKILVEPLDNEYGGGPGRGDGKDK